MPVSPIPVTGGEGTPKFERNNTAVFGSFAQMSEFAGVKQSDLVKESDKDSEEKEAEIIMRSFASKKSSMISILYTQREILLFSDGSFAYKRKNKSEKTKQLIK
jgi:hypothetical protein